MDLPAPEADIVVATALPTLESAPPSVDVKGVNACSIMCTSS